MRRSYALAFLAFVLAACGGGGGPGETPPDADTTCPDCPPGCGDGVCTATETCGTCSLDCGACGELGHCDDASDNDGDGLIDCADNECTGDPACPVAGTQLAAEAGLILQDVADDGAYVAYTDSTGQLFAVATDGGAPVALATGVDQARYMGHFHFAYQGIDATGKIAATMQVFPEGSASSVRVDSQVRVRTVDASPDGDHYVYRRVAGGGAQDLLLDGAVVFASIDTAKQAFTSTSAYLVAAIAYTDPGSGQLVQTVISYPVAGGAPIPLLASGAGPRIALTPSGSGVVLGANAGGGQADLELVPVTGGASTPLVTADDHGFEVLPDGVTLAFSDAGALRTIHLDGSGLATRVAAGVVALEDTSAQAIVYATAQDAVTGLETLRIVRLDGGGDSALGSLAVSEGFTPGAGTLGLRDQISGASGRLEILPVATLAESLVATAIVKSSFPDDARVVYLDATGDLDVVSLAGGAATAIQDRVGAFKLVPDALASPTRGRAAFVVPSGANPGLYIVPL